MVVFKEFRLGELFNKKTIKGVPKRFENLNRNDNGYHMFGQNVKYQYTQKIKLDNKYLQSVEQDKPILGYTSSTGEIGIITESFYRSGDNGAFQGLFLKKDKYTKFHLLYLMTGLKKHFDTFGYSTGMSDILNLSIKLPITKSGKPDWEYMSEYVKRIEAEYVKRIEAEYVKRIEAYLTVLGYPDVESVRLTKKDENVLSLHASAELSMFKVGELFEIKPTKNYGLSNVDLFKSKGKYPVITNSSSNNGITNYIDKLPTMPGNMVTFSDTTTDDAIFYQPNDFVGYSHVQGMKPKQNVEKWNKQEYLYFITIFKKIVSGKYNYGTKFNRLNAAEEIVELPVNTEGLLDFELMGNYMKVIQKKMVLKLKEELDNKLKLYEKVSH